jgi:outer membrane biosynthesis protein TonB
MADSEQIVHDVAERVRELVVEAEQRAAAIVADAEREAKAIRERAEAEAKQRLGEVREALDQLQGKLGGGPAGATEAEVEPGPVIVPEPEPPAVPEPAPSPEPTPQPPEPEPPSIPEPAPPPDEGTPPAAGNGAARSDDAAGARLVAMNMALEGASRERIADRLRDDFELDDPGKLVDEVLALTAK